jgi:hypothetical protein
VFNLRKKLISVSDFSHFEFAPQITPSEPTSSFQPPSISSDVPPPQLPTTSVSSKSQPAPNAAIKYRCHCGYIPNGEEKWKASNLSRHKRTQHPGKGSKVYKCGWQGCGSTFTRSDNLREHIRKKGHEVWCLTDGKEKEMDDGEARRKRRKEKVRDDMDTEVQ